MNKEFFFHFECSEGQDHLEKSREIIRKLQEDKKRLSDEMKQKIESSEQQLEQEKDGLVEELKRGKAAAIALMQVLYIDLFSCRHIFMGFSFQVFH